MLGQAMRAATVPPFHAMAMNRLAATREAAGHRVLHLEVGQPSTPAPLAARQVVAEALTNGSPFGYTNAPGLLSLRRRISRFYAEQYAATVDPESIIVVAGASAGFSLTFLAAFDPGQRVGVLEPGYPCYRNTLLALGVLPVPIPVGAATRWAPTAELLDAAGPLDGVVIASPSNPTGTVLDAETLGGVSEWCAAHGAQLVADEIYHGITFTAPCTSVTAIDPTAVVINSFSKYYSMTGWRLGWVIVPDHLRDAVERLQQNLYICAAHVSQVAGLAAMDCADELDSHVQRYAANRVVLLDGLAAAGLRTTSAADGAFYVYADVSHLGHDSLTLCRRWLDEIDVATTPGIDFDTGRGDDWVRFSYAGDSAVLAEACERLQRWQP
jgi:aspartate/methionine/tyrosine aminotransferase